MKKITILALLLTWGTATWAGENENQETEEQRGAVFEKNQEDTETENTDIQDKTKIEQEEKQLEVSGEESTLMTTEQSEEVNGDKLEDDEVNIDVSCECEYHKSTDKYCKHVYSLLLKLKLIYEKEKMLEKYN